MFKIILGQIPPTSGTVKIGTGVEIGYYDQELTSLNPNNTIIDELWDSFTHMTETEIRNALAARLFKGDDVYKPVASLSGGEKSRLILTKLVLANNNFLMLDEPTNHLDMPSREELEKALIEFPGTILMISHDRYFLNKIANRIIVLESGKIKEYLGNYDDYINKKRQMEILENQSKEQTPQLTRTALKEQRCRERLERQKTKEERERLKSLEEEIHRLAQEIEALEYEMADPKLYEDKEEMFKVQQQYEKLKDEVDKLYTEWMELA